MFENSEGFSAIEIDIHGDRECAQASGGIACLVRSLPAGFGVSLSDPIEMLGDINDVRPANSKSLPFSVQAAIRWTRQRQRPAGLLAVIAGNPPEGSGKQALRGDYLLDFRTASDHLMWSEIALMRTVTLVDMFWHVHHKYTYDAWVVSATASDLGLRESIFSKTRPEVPINLSEHGLQVQDAMDIVLDHLRLAQSKCVSVSCAQEPRLRCYLDRNRWEMLPSGSIQERFSRPLCHPWTVQASEVFTLLSFHRKLFDADDAVMVWMHTIFYATYISDADQVIPHGMVVVSRDAI